MQLKSSESRITNFSVVDSNLNDKESYLEKSQKIKEILSKKKDERDAALLKQMNLLGTTRLQQGALRGSRNQRSSLSALHSNQVSIQSGRRSSHIESAGDNDFGVYKKRSPDGRILETVRLSDIINKYGHLQG